MALSIKPDGFTRDLLERALGEEYKNDVGGERWTEGGATGVPGSTLPPSPHLSISGMSRIARSESLSASAQDGHSPRPDISRALAF